MEPATRIAKTFVAQPVRERQEHGCGQEEPERRAKLRKHPVPRALAGRRVLDRQEYRSAPFAAQAQSLPEAAQGQQRGAATPIDS